MEVWKGLHVNRPDLRTVVHPTFEDYCEIVQQIAKTQQFVLSALGNLKVMPNLEATIKEAGDKLQALKAQVDATTPPQELKESIVALAELIDSQDVRDLVASMRREVEALKSMVGQGQLELLKLQDAFNREVKGFQAQIWNALKKMDHDLQARLSQAEEKLESMQTQVQIQTLLEKLKK